MACCIGKSSQEAMTCCASAEGRQNTDLSAATAAAALPAPEPVALKLASDVISEIGATSAVIESHEPLVPDLERHVLLSVFLI